MPVIHGIGTNQNVLKLINRHESFMTMVITLWDDPLDDTGCNTITPGADPGGGRTRRAPPKIGKNKIFWRKIVIFHTKYPKNYLPLPPLGVIFLSDLSPNLKSWIRPCTHLIFFLIVTWHYAHIFVYPVPSCLSFSYGR